MKFYRNKTSRYFIMIMLCLVLVPLPGNADIVIETEIVSGTITKVRGGVVELDGNGTLYYPFNKMNKMTLKRGNTVTLRYFVDMRDPDKPTKKYTEYALGINSLAPKPKRLPHRKIGEF